MLRKTTPVPSRPTPAMPMRIGKRHDPDDEFFTKKPRDQAHDAEAGPSSPGSAPDPTAKPPPADCESS